LRAGYEVEPQTIPGGLAISTASNSRHRVLKGGKILFGRVAVIGCIVRNLSDTGACMQVDTPIGIPDAFNLSISAEPSVKACRVVWRKEKQIGVAFQQ
jgi:PilZ domain-containing protein